MPCWVSKVVDHDPPLAVDIGCALQLDVLDMGGAVFDITGDRP